MGVETPVRLNPVPLIPICEIVTLVPPVLVRVSSSDELLPTVMLPKLKLVGLGVMKPGETPVPESPIVSDGFEAFDVTVTVPLALPADVGVNVTWKLVACPPVRVMGVVTPLRLNPVPAIEICEIVTLVAPVFVTVSSSEELEPTVIDPKLRLVGFDVRSPGEIPVPVRGMARDGFDALEVTVTVPLALAAEVGANTTWKLVLCPAPTVIGVVAPLRLKPAPEIAICEMVTLVPPLLVTVARSDELLPTVTFPKLMAQRSQTADATAQNESLHWSVTR